jgi:hypothetical protein
MHNQNLDSNTLWSNERCLIFDGILFNNGEILCIDISYAKPGETCCQNGITSLDSLVYKNPDWMTSLSKTASLAINNGNKSVVCGEGGMGGDGFIAVVDSIKHELEWIFFSQTSNPFIALSESGGVITAATNIDTIWQISLEYPKSIKRIA